MTTLGPELPCFQDKIWGTEGLADLMEVEQLTDRWNVSQDSPIPKYQVFLYNRKPNKSNEKSVKLEVAWLMAEG